MSFPKIKLGALVITAGVFMSLVGSAPAMAATDVTPQLEASDFVVSQGTCDDHGLRTLDFSFNYTGGPDDWFIAMDPINDGPEVASGSVTTENGSVTGTTAGQPAGTLPVMLYGSRGGQPAAQTIVVIGDCVVADPTSTPTPTPTPTPTQTSTQEAKSVVVTADCGFVTAMNPNDSTVTFMYGSFDSSDPDGVTDVAAGATVKILTARSQLDWIAYVTTDPELYAGDGSVEVDQKCSTSTPTPTPTPKVTPTVLQTPPKAPAVWKPAAATIPVVAAAHNTVPPAKTDWADHQSPGSNLPWFLMGIFLIGGVGFSIRTLRSLRAHH